MNTGMMLTIGFLILWGSLVSFLLARRFKKDRKVEIEKDKLLEYINSCNSFTAWAHWYQRGIEFNKKWSGSEYSGYVLEIKNALLFKSKQLQEEICKPKNIQQ